ncbi:MAG: rRNA maturation RNase YbeY [Candidatus Promineifilaceae bacterium]
MTFSIVVETEVATSAEIPALLQSTARTALTQQQVAQSADVTILLTDDATLRNLNQTYRGIDKVTDVLSFTDGEAPTPDAPIYLGDLAISLPQATRQAERGGHVVSAELQLLVVHGVLHLLGYDHATPAEKAAMWAAQAAILTQLNAPITAPSAATTL